MHTLLILIACKTEFKKNILSWPIRAKGIEWFYGCYLNFFDTIQVLIAVLVYITNLPQSIGIQVSPWSYSLFLFSVLIPTEKWWLEQVLRKKKTSIRKIKNDENYWQWLYKIYRMLRLFILSFNIFDSLFLKFIQKKFNN